MPKQPAVGISDTTRLWCQIDDRDRRWPGWHSAPGGTSLGRFHQEHRILVLHAPACPSRMVSPRGSSVRGVVVLEHIGSGAVIAPRKNEVASNKVLRSAEIAKLPNDPFVIWPRTEISPSMTRILLSTRVRRGKLVGNVQPMSIVGLELRRLPGYSTGRSANAAPAEKYSTAAVTRCVAYRCSSMRSSPSIRTYKSGRRRP